MIFFGQDIFLTLAPLFWTCTCFLDLAVFYFGHGGTKFMWKTCVSVFPGPKSVRIFLDLDEFVLDLAFIGTPLFYALTLGWMILGPWHLKVHRDDPAFFELDLFWLPESMTFDEGLALAKEERARGLAEKGAAGRLASRFDSATVCADCANEKSLPDTSHLGRFKVTGVIHQVPSTALAPQHRSTT
jgi:hypothetical protein